MYHEGKYSVSPVCVTNVQSLHCLFMMQEKACHSLHFSMGTGTALDWTRLAQSALFSNFVRMAPAGIANVVLTCRRL